MSSGPYAAPWSDVGRLQGDIDRLGHEVHRKADAHELHQTNRNVDSLERECRELRSEVDGLRYELQQLREDLTNTRYLLECLSPISTGE